ncbi:MAG: DUF2461 domain-containing protein [Thermoplasmatota archaeon]
MRQTLQGGLDRLLPFLEELARNNDRTWFEANRARYDADVRDPALRLVEAMQEPLLGISPHLVADPRPGGSLLRIHRDLRFAKDRSPYKTYASIRFFHRADDGRRDVPSYHLRLAPGASSLEVGIREPPRPALARIRSAILDDDRGWRAVLAAGLEWGPPPRTKPAGVPSDHPFAEDLRRRGFAAHIPFSDEQVVGAAFPATLADASRKGAPLNAFLAKAVGMEW